MDRRRSFALVGAVALAVLVGLVPSWVPAPPAAPPRATYNLDPAFSAANNDLVWDPNFIPGFGQAPGVHVQWTDPKGGPGTIDYYVGPWTNGSVAPYPHFTVGPQAFNFAEVPRTQVFRSPQWGDYQSVQEGFLPCAVNLGNYTVNATQAVHPVYIGLPVAGVNWTVTVPIDWSAPVESAAGPVSGAFAIGATIALPALPGALGARLVYTNLILWDAAPVTESVVPIAGASSGGDVGQGTFPLLPLLGPATTRTYTVGLSSYLASTLEGLGLPISSALLSYVYLETSGYNVHLHVSFGGLDLTGPTGLCASPGPQGVGTGAAAPGAAVGPARRGD